MGVQVGIYYTHWLSYMLQFLYDYKHPSADAAQSTDVTYFAREILTASTICAIHKFRDNFRRARETLVKQPPAAVKWAREMWFSNRSISIDLIHGDSHDRSREMLKFRLGGVRVASIEIENTKYSHLISDTVSLSSILFTTIIRWYKGYLT